MSVPIKRKRQARIGETMVSQNGYHYTKVATDKGPKNWRLTHHIIAEKKLGRPIREDERVVFVDGDRTHLLPDNIAVVEKRKKTKAKIIAEIRGKIEDLQNQLREMGEEP